MGAYSDIMVYCGFGRLESLFTATLAWRTVFDQLRPDLIVCDHSPIVCFAAYGRTPVVQVGDGFTLPPAAGDSFPRFQAKNQAPVPDDTTVPGVNEGDRHPGGPPRHAATARRRPAGRPAP